MPGGGIAQDGLHCAGNGRVQCSLDYRIAGQFSQNLLDGRGIASQHGSDDLIASTGQHAWHVGMAQEIRHHRTDRGRNSRDRLRVGEQAGHRRADRRAE